MRVYVKRMRSRTLPGVRIAVGYSTLTVLTPSIGQDTALGFLTTLRPGFQEPSTSVRNGWSGMPRLPR